MEGSKMKAKEENVSPVDRWALSCAELYDPFDYDK